MVLAPPTSTGTSRWRPVAFVAGRPAVSLARTSRAGELVTLLRFDQSLVKLALHSGSADPGGTGWRYGSAIGAAERKKVIAGFQGGFMLSDHVGGFLSQGRLKLALTPGFASIVTYASGASDIGSWKHGVPAAGRRVFSVRQNLKLLVNRGRAASNVDSCIVACWGPTLGGRHDNARGGLGIDSAGRLIYAGGERLSVSALAGALVAAGARRAAELDINPQWVNLYLYTHRKPGHTIGVVPLIPGQPGIPGQLLAPYKRDFFTVLAR